LNPLPGVDVGISDVREQVEGKPFLERTAVTVVGNGGELGSRR
jgi:hypothetical protein